jgi:phosphoribosylamine--glycine ligase
MKVNVIGGGGREHALRVVLGRTAEIVDEPDAADLVVIGPEQQLIDGLADELRAAGLRVLGPGADGAQLEGSKAWMKELLASAAIPTARHRAFADADGVEAFLDSLPGPYVIKTDYLAAGKGVLVTDALAAAVDDARAKLEHGGIIIEEGMTGPELTLLCVCDGHRAVPLASSRDHKRVGTGDVGPMTGGMGAFSPVDGVDGESLAKAIVQPTLDALRERGIDYRGVLYAGLMLTPDGPKVVEYNVRFGDPETQVVVPRFDGDFAAFLLEAAGGDLRTEPRFVDDAWVTVALAAEGYPGSVRTGDPIAGLDAAAALDGVTIFEAAVKRDTDGVARTAGGRVLNVCGSGSTLDQARARAYEAVDLISFTGMHYRRDIAS